LSKLVSLPGGMQGGSYMETGYSSFVFQASCFDTSIVTPQRLTNAQNGLHRLNPDL